MTLFDDFIDGFKLIPCELIGKGTWSDLAATLGGLTFLMVVIAIIVLLMIII